MLKRFLANPALLKQASLTLSVGWIFLLFLIWDFRIIASLETSYFLPVILDFDALSNITSWQHLSWRIEQGDLFLSNDDLTLIPHLLLPTVSLWVNALFNSVFGYTVAYLFFSVVFPTLSYVYLVKIYNAFLSLRWSIFISALGVLSLVNYPFRDFLIALLTNDLPSSLPTFDHPSVIGQPFPSFSLMVFLIIFYHSIGQARVAGSRHIFLSFLWGLQSQIHILNFSFGVPFWVIILTIHYWRRSRGQSYKEHLKPYLLNIGIIAALCAPLIWSALSIENQVFGNITSEFDWFTVSTYMLAPVMLTALCFLIFRVDPYELLIKFYLIWITMLVELGLILAWKFMNFGIPSDVIYNRLGVYFLHLFYFVPSIYYFHRSNVQYNSGFEANVISLRLRQIMSFAFDRSSIVYIPAFMFLLTAFMVLGANNVKDNFDKHIKRYYEMSAQSAQAASRDGNVNTPYSAASHIFLMSQSGRDEGWINVFTNPMSTEEAVNIFAQYAHDNEWTEDMFLTFMLPASRYNAPLQRSIYQAINAPGLGFWLSTNKTVANDEPAFKAMVLNSFKRKKTLK